MATPFGSYDAQKCASWREFFDPLITGIGDKDVSGSINCNGPRRIKPTLPTVPTPPWKAVTAGSDKSSSGTVAGRGIWNPVNH